MKKMHVSMKTKRAVNGLLFILPWLVGFLLFYVRSLYQTVQFSLSSLDVLPTGGYELDFIGLKNFITAFTGHGTFKQTLVTSLSNMLIDVPLIIFFSLFVAMLLNRKMKCRGLVRAIFFLPVLLNSEAIAGTLQFAAQMMAGGLNGTSAEMAEAAAMEVYLPKQLSEAEVEAELLKIIAETGACQPSDMGKVMGVATKRLAGLAEGRLISTLVKKLLSK